MSKRDEVTGIKGGWRWSVVHKGSPHCGWRVNLRREKRSRTANASAVQYSALLPYFTDDFFQLQDCTTRATQ